MVSPRPPQNIQKEWSQYSIRRDIRFPRAIPTRTLIARKSEISMDPPQPLKSSQATLFYGPQSNSSLNQHKELSSSAPFVFHIQAFRKTLLNAKGCDLVVNLRFIPRSGPEDAPYHELSKEDQIMLRLFIHALRLTLPCFRHIVRLKMESKQPQAIKPVIELIEEAGQFHSRFEFRLNGASYTRESPASIELPSSISKTEHIPGSESLLCALRDNRKEPKSLLLRSHHGLIKSY